MKPYFFILLLLLLSCHVHAQDSSTTQRYTIVRLALGPQPEFYGKRFTYTFMPAIERRFGRYGIQLQAGIMMPIAYNVQDETDKVPLTGYAQWYSLRACLRKYKVTKDKAGLYVGGEVFAGVLTTPRNDAYHNFKEPAKGAYGDAFVLTKRMAGVGFTIGFQRYVSRCFLLGMHGSAGLKLKYTTAEQRINAEDYTVNRHDIEFVDKIGFSAGMAGMLSFSVGYAFR